MSEQVETLEVGPAVSSAELEALVGAPLTPWPVNTDDYVAKFKKDFRKHLAGIVYLLDQGATHGVTADFQISRTPDGMKFMVNKFEVTKKFDTQQDD